MSENYTKGIQKVLKLSKQISLKMGHTYVGSEHFILGMIDDTTGRAASTLIALGADLD